MRVWFDLGIIALVAIYQDGTLIILHLKKNSKNILRTSEIIYYIFFFQFYHKCQTKLKFDPFWTLQTVCITRVDKVPNIHFQTLLMVSSGLSYEGDPPTKCINGGWMNFHNRFVNVNFQRHIRNAYKIYIRFVHIKSSKVLTFLHSGRTDFHNSKILFGFKFSFYLHALNRLVKRIVGKV